MADIYIGTSGWHYKHWVGTFLSAENPCFEDARLLLRALRYR